MKKPAIFIAALMAALSASLVTPANAASQEAAVRLPAFNVNLNSYYPIAQLDAYPPILYKDIVYVPMTWNNGLRLNLHIEWNESDGLAISRRPTEMYDAPYEPPATESNDMNKLYKAAVAAYPITVNGRVLDNANEPYPILSFRDITYFPLTWRFAHEEFDWTTDWSPEDGFGLIAGDRKYVMSSITADFDDSLHIGTHIYGMLQIDKSLQGTVQSYKGKNESNEQAMNDNQRMQHIRFAPGMLSNRTRLEGERVMLGHIELMSIQPALDRLNEQGYNFTVKNVHLEDSVLPLDLDGSRRLVSISASFPSITALFLVNGAQAAQLDHYEVYRKKENPDGSLWVTTAAKYSEPHHYSWYEVHLWLIGKEGRAELMNERLGAKTVQVLSAPEDGSVIVLASKEDSIDSDIARDVYRIGPDGKAEKMYGSVKGLVSADRSGEVFVLSSAENKITKLSTGESVRLSEKMLFLASRGKPQPIEASKERP